MKIRKRILKTVVIGIIFLSLFSTWYINKFLAPIRLKNFFIKNISQAVDRPVSINNIHFNLIRGFILNELTLYEADGKNTFIKIDRLSTTLLFIPLFREKKIIIPYIQITSPSINIIKNQDNTWNFLSPPLLKKEVIPEKIRRKGFSFWVQKIRIENGEINFLDNTKTPSYINHLTKLDGEVIYSIKDGVILFKTISQLNTPLKTTMGLDGSYRLNENLLILKAAVKNLPLSEPYNYFYKPKIPLRLKEGITDLSLDLKMDKDKKLALYINSSIKNLDVSSFGLNLKGNLGMNATFDLTPFEPPQLNYKIELDLAGPILSGIYILNELSNLSGRIEIKNDEIYSAGLVGYAHNTPIKFIGGVDLKNLLLRLNASATLDLINYKLFLPKELKEQFKDIDLEGPAEIDIKFFDNLKDPQPVTIDGEMKLKGAALKTAMLPNRFENCFGEISFKNDALYFSRTTFDYGTQNYTLDAKIVNLQLPDVKMKLKNNGLSLDSRFQILKESIHLLRLTGKYDNSSFNLSGNIEKKPNPNINMRGNLALDLFDLRKLLPNISQPLTRFDIQGLCNLELNLKGPLKEPATLEAVAKGQSNKISFWNLKLNDVNFYLSMKGGRLLISEFSARPYDGTFLSTMEIDLLQQNPPYIINLAMEDINLTKLVADTDLKKKPISGKALFKSSIRGYGKNLETIKGEGLIFIKGGYLWEIPLLRGVADLLFMPNLSSIVFDEAACHFTIANKVISTSDLKFHSQNVGLLAEGNLNFDGMLDFLVTTSISENFLKGTTEFERITGALLAEAGQFIGRIKIGGTIKKPEYKFIPFPLDKILKDKLKGLLGGFF